MESLSQNVIDRVKEDIANCLPHISVDCVIFKYSDGQLLIPVVHTTFAEMWLIPGGYVRRDEDIDDAARRILLDQTDIQGLLLSQFGAFGSRQRTYLNEYQNLNVENKNKEVFDWVTQRFITIGYYSILSDQSVISKTGNHNKNIKWINVEEADCLSMDHGALLTAARRALARELLSKPVLLGLLPDTFTIPQLHKLYELILERPIDRGNFRQRILKSNFLIKIGKSTVKTNSRPPLIYKLDKDAYINSLTDNVKLGF